MSIHVALNHVTHYRYDRRVSLGPQLVRLRPAPHCRTRILSYSLRVEPTDHWINWQQDPFANYVARLQFHEPTREFKVTVDLVAEMSVLNPFDFFLEPEAENFPFSYAEDVARDLVPYLVKCELTPKLKAFVDSTPLPEQRTIDFLVGINQRLQTDIKYLIRMEPGVQTPEDTLTNGSGSCRDTGWLMVQALVEADQEIDGAPLVARDAVDEGFELRRQLALDQVGLQVVLELGRVGKRVGLGIGLEEEVERVVDGHVGHQVDRDLELGRLVGKHQPRQVVGERVLLPIDEMAFGLDAQRVAQDGRAAVRCRAQAHDLRAQRDAAVVAVVGDVVQRDMDGHGALLLDRESVLSST